jgi:DNA modification methylase
MNVQLFQGDCLEFMCTLPAGSIDAVVTDPPYGKQWARGNNSFGTIPENGIKKESVDWDKLRPSIEYIDEIRRISEMQVIWGGNYFTDFLPPSNCWLVWDKLGEMTDGAPFADFEMAWCSLNKVPRKFILRNRGFIRDSKDQRYHPTQKPTELMLWVLENYTQPGQTIFDPFMGSGTTGVACMMTGRNFIGCEIDPGYFQIAQRRIAIAQMQPRLLP